MTVLILGATSDVAVSLARQFGHKGYNLQLAARDTEVLQSLKSDIEIRHSVNVITVALDALDYKSHASLYHDLPQKPDIVILVFGYLGEHVRALQDWTESEQIINTNYTGAVSILNVIANDFAERRAGVIVGISSVAGDRGRMSNYIYGSAKAGLSAYLSGLRNRLAHAGVHVMTVKPGFMRTQMTEGLSLPPLLTTEPDDAAAMIIRGTLKRKNVIYVSSIWYVVMLIIRSIPEMIFKKLKL